MTPPLPDPNAITPEGYDQPAPAPYQGQQVPPGPQQQPVPQPQQPYAGQQPGYPAGPAQPYAGQQQYPSQPVAPMQPQYQSQPPVPNPVYGYPQPKSKVVAGLLGIFLGPLGIHRFYLGFTKIAVIQLVLTIVLGAFTFGLVGLWGVIEGIMIIAGSAHLRTDAQGVPLRD